jgi:hypothetical protein
MEGKLKRVRFRKDGKLDIEFETEDGRTEIAEGCTLHIETDPNSGDEVSWQKVDSQAAAAASGEEDITEGGAGQGGNQGGGTTGGELEG